MTRRRAGAAIATVATLLALVTASLSPAAAERHQDATATAASRPGTGEAAASTRATRRPWVTAYYAGWFWDRMQPPQRVDMTAMTHFVFGRIAPGDGSLGGAPGEVLPGAGTAHDPGTAPDGSGRSVEDYLVRRAHAAGTKALVMLGGDGLDGRGFLRSTRDPVRPRFVDAVADHVVAHGYDGVDVDWESCLDGESGCTDPGREEPVPAAEARRRLRALLVELRRELDSRRAFRDRRAILTFPGYPVNTNFLEDGRVERWRARVAALVDQYNLMSYGVGTTWSGSGWHSWFSGALTGASPTTPVDIASSIDAYVAAGVPRRRLGIGIGFFGVYYGPSVTGPRQPTDDEPVFVANDVSLAWSELHRKGYLSHGTGHWDERARSTWRSYGSGGYVPSADPGAPPAGMLSHESPRSIAAKGAWVRRTGVGGTIVWTINYGWLPGQGRNPMMAAVKRSFLR